MRFRTDARTLQSFCRTMGDIAIAEATAERVLAFIAGGNSGRTPEALGSGEPEIANAASAPVAPRKSPGPTGIKSQKTVEQS
jgi:hypothetical protein